MILNHHRVLKRQNHPHLPLNLTELFQSTQQIGAFQIRVLQSLSQVLFTSLHRDSFWTFWAIWIQQELEHWQEIPPEICLTPGLLPLQADRKKWTWREIVVIQAMTLEAAHQLAETLPLEEESLEMLLGIKDALVEDSSNFDPKGFEMVPLGLPLLTNKDNITLSQEVIDPAIRKLPNVKIIISPSHPKNPQIGLILTSWLWAMNKQYGEEVSYLGLLFIANAQDAPIPWKTPVQYKGSHLINHFPHDSDTLDSKFKHLSRRIELVKQSPIEIQEHNLEHSRLETREDKIWNIEDLAITHEMTLEGHHGDRQLYYESGDIQEVQFSISPGHWCQHLIDLFDEDCLMPLATLSQIARNLLNINLNSPPIAFPIAIFIFKQYWQGHSDSWTVGELLRAVQSDERLQSLATNSMRRHTFFQEWNSTLEIYKSLGWKVSDNPIVAWESEPINNMDWLEQSVFIQLSTEKAPPQTAQTMTSQVPVIEAPKIPVPGIKTVRKMEKISGNDLEHALSTKGMSQAKLARSLNLDRSTINRWINGSRPIHPRYRPALWELLGEELSH